jgi:uncharacterized membrane protein
VVTTTASISEDGSVGGLAPELASLAGAEVRASTASGLIVARIGTAGGRFYGWTSSCSLSILFSLYCPLEI